MCIGEWEEMGKVSRRSVSREVFLNLGMTPEQDGMRQSFQGAPDGWGSPHNGEHAFHFTVPGKFTCWHHLMIVPII